MRRVKREKVEVKNKLGIHARVAAMIVQEASRFASDAYLDKNGMRANCKSILGLLALGASRGTVLELIVEGKDEDRAFEALKRLFEERFGEEE